MTTHRKQPEAPATTNAAAPASQPEGAAATATAQAAAAATDATLAAVPEQHAHPTVAEPSAKPGRREYTVAPNRSLVTDDGSKGPGEPVTFDTLEGGRLVDLGFLLDEDGLQRGVAGGPPTVSGVEIKEQ